MVIRQALNQWLGGLPEGRIWIDKHTGIQQLSASQGERPRRDALLPGTQEDPILMTPFLDFQPPDLWDNQFSVCNPLSLLGCYGSLGCKHREGLLQRVFICRSSLNSLCHSFCACKLHLLSPVTTEDEGWFIILKLQLYSLPMSETPASLISQVPASASEQYSPTHVM